MYRAVLLPFLFLLTIINTPPLLSQEMSSDDPVVALVLAGGGALGFAHVGALKVLEEEGIHPDLVIGASMGSIVGGLYCTGYSAEEIENLVIGTDWKETMLDNYDRRKLSYEKRRNQPSYNISLGTEKENRVSDAGLSQAQHVMELLDAYLAPYTTEMDFDDLPVPFRAVGADLLTGEKVVMGKGDLKRAIRASMAVPGIFTPVEYGDRFLIDGGWAENLPTTVAREMGADIVIAVSLFSLEGDMDKLNTVGAVTAQADQIRTLERYRMSREAADLIISPELSGYTMADFERSARLSELGYQAADRMRGEIRALADSLKKDRLASQARTCDDRVIPLSAINVSIDGNRVREEKLEKEITEALGDAPRLSEIRQKLYSLYDRGDYTHVWYRLVPADGEKFTMEVDAPGGIIPENSFSLALDFSSQAIEGRITEFSLKTSYQRWLDNSRRNRLELELRLSDFPSLATEFDHKFPDRDMSLGGEAHFRSDTRYFFEDSTVSSLYGRQILGAETYLEHSFFDRFDIKGVLYYDFFWMDHQLGVDFLEDETWQRLGARGIISIDTLDRRVVPRKGVNAVYLVEGGVDREGNRIGFYKTAGLVYLSLTDFLVAVPRWEAQGLLAGTLSPLEAPTLGNYISLYGYYPQELRDENAVMGGMEIRIKLASLPLGIGNDVYLAAGGNYAALWEDDIQKQYDNYRDFYGFGTGLILNTILGEVSFTISGNRDGRLSSFFGISTSLPLAEKL